MESSMQVVSAQPCDRRKIIKKTAVLNSIPDEVVNDTVLNAAIAASLPSNYNFEVHKIIWRVRSIGAKRVALQFPEGLFIFSSPIAVLVESFTGAEVIVLSDVAYGACCVDDFTAVSLKCQLLVHFAHSCLVPVNTMVNGLKILYVFVDIKFDVWHLVETVKANIGTNGRIAFASTIQFLSSIHSAVRTLESSGYDIIIPQSRPLSKGEVLGCTSPKLPSDVHTVVFVADGRFHLEAMMIANPDIENFLRYNPYDKKMSRESYEFSSMIEGRKRAITEARMALRRGGSVGVILGSLGRQGSPAVFEKLKERIREKAPACFVSSIIIPEIKPKLLNSFKDSIDLWVQVACPRLSIDWGDGFVHKPLLTPYELNLALHCVSGIEDGGIKLTNDPTRSSYPMDFYSTHSLGDWTPSHKCNKGCNCTS